MKELVVRLNEYFLRIILVFFYVVFVGIAFALYRLFKKKESGGASYWVPGQKESVDYMSAY